MLIFIDNETVAVTLLQLKSFKSNFQDKSIQLPALSLSFSDLKQQPSVQKKFWKVWKKQEVKQKKKKKLFKSSNYLPPLDRFYSLCLC